MRKPPKIFETAATFFPALHLLIIGVLVASTFISFSWLKLSLLPMVIFVLPLLLWRIFALFFPIREGVSYVGRREAVANSWYISNRLQIFFISFSFFERMLMLFPGAFSFWLRLWGSKIGTGIFWSPGVQVFDRTALKLGNFVIFGNDVTLSGHIVKRTHERILVYYKPLTIGARSLVGYASHVAPGVCIAEKAQVEAGTRLYPNQKVEMTHEN